MVRLSEPSERAGNNSLSNLSHGVKVKPQIVERIKSCRSHFSVHEKVPQVRP